MIHRRTFCLSIGTPFLGNPASAQAPSKANLGAILLSEVTGQPARAFSTQDFGREKYFKARSVLVPMKKAEALLPTLRERLPQGFVAFVGTMNSLAEPEPDGVELVVAEGADQFEILRVAATDGVNHGLTTEAIIAELRQWDRVLGIDIWQASTDVVSLRLKSLPKNVDAFSRRVYKFCPDIVDQGFGDVGKLTQHIATKKSVYLWWD